MAETQRVCACLIIKGQRRSGGGWWHFQELTGFQRDWILAVHSEKSLCFSDFSAVFLLASLSGELCVDTLCCGSSSNPVRKRWVCLSFVALENVLQPCDWTDKRGFPFLFLLLSFCCSACPFVFLQTLVICPSLVGEWGNYLFPTGEEGLCTKRRNASQARTTDLHDNEAPYLFSFNKCRNFAQAHIANPGANAQWSQIQSIQNQVPERKKCQGCKSMFRIKTAGGIPSSTTG